MSPPRLPRAGDTGPAWIGADAVEHALPMAAAIDVLEQALLGGLDPEQDGERTKLDTPAGQLLQMPSADQRFVGTKLVTSCPGNQGTDRPVIQGVYVLFDGVVMSPVAMLDGAALTSVRTPAVSGLAVRHLSAPGAARLALFGTGVQAWGHVLAMAAVLDLEHVDVIGRTRAAVDRLVERIRATGVSAAAAGTDVVSAADVVVCATAAREPLFDGELVPAHAVTVAIGTHDPGHREVDTTLVRRSSVVVESRSSALREAGDVVIPIAEGALTTEDLISLADVVRGVVVPPTDRPRLFKGTGMPWEDLATAGAIAVAVAELHNH
jgi:ornithine cyclodeaminase/alanine dehydrogenase-like protein (mu-crystallin family)